MNNFGKHPICKDCIINKKFIFSSLNEEELNIISSEKECIYYEKGQIIYQEGNKINGFYCVNKGILKLLTPWFGHFCFTMNLFPSAFRNIIAPCVPHFGQLNSLLSSI